MKSSYTKDKGCFDQFDDQADVDLWELEAKPTMFHIGQRYEDEPAKKITCIQCGGEQFNVGQGDYFTAIRCVKCEWETGIHEG